MLKASRCDRCNHKTVSGIVGYSRKETPTERRTSIPLEYGTVLTMLGAERTRFAPEQLGKQHPVEIRHMLRNQQFFTRNHSY